MLYSADFETTTDPEDCRVWAWGSILVGMDKGMEYGNTLDSFMAYIENEHIGDTFYFHNIKFDGEFIINWLFRHGFTWQKERKHMQPKQFTTLISDKGQFYSMEICFGRTGRKLETVKLLDSLKVLPFSVDQIAKAFKLPMQKLTIDYTEERKPGHDLTMEEIAYLKNDITIVSLSLQTLFDENLTRMTQGSNALADYKEIIGRKQFQHWFPIPDAVCDKEIRASYKGGFTFANPKFKGQTVGEGIVLDVNSLYPSVMYFSDLPYGEGIRFDGEYTPDEMYPLYIIQFTCMFELRDGYLPTVQGRNVGWGGMATEYIERCDTVETLCMTCVDFELFKEHYEIYDLEFHFGWKFRSSDQMFRPYIDKWYEIKTKATLEGNHPMRTLAKLMLNALYGKFALNPHVQSKKPVFEDDRVKYKLLESETRDPIYIPVGTFITAWARNKTIRSAQAVYDRFLYADTDSLHLLGLEEPKGIEVDETKLGAWKHESTFRRAKFLRAKSYIEDTYVPRWKEGEEPIAHHYTPLPTVGKEVGTVLKITCAGMPDKCYPGVTFENFEVDAEYTGKLKPAHVPGGIVLESTPFKIRKA